MIESIKFILKRSFLYGILAIVFSLIGFILIFDKIPPPKIVNPVEVIGFVSIEHIVGHIIWGMMAGLATLSLRYTILSGFFAILIDSDNLLRFFDFLSISRMAHSIPFGIMAIVVMMFVFGKKDVKLGAICIAAVFAHISFDTISGRVSNFLLFTPFYNEKIVFSGIDWIFFINDSNNYRWNFYHIHKTVTS